MANPEFSPSSKELTEVNKKLAEANERLAQHLDVYALLKSTQGGIPLGLGSFKDLMSAGPIPETKPLAPLRDE